MPAAVMAIYSRTAERRAGELEANSSVMKPTVIRPRLYSAGVMPPAELLGAAAVGIAAIASLARGAGSTTADTAPGIETAPLSPSINLGGTEKRHPRGTHARRPPGWWSAPHRSEPACSARAELGRNATAANRMLRRAPL